MADFISAIAKAAGYAGVERIFEYVNGDGRLVKWNCGQAAAATLLTHCGAVAPRADACNLLRLLERRFPPDILGGWFGSSRRRVASICKAHGVALKDIRGEREFRGELSRGNPVIVMLGVSGGRLGRWDLPGGHWMVAYGYDDVAVYLTNWGEPMPWAEFRKRWRSVVSRCVQMGERGLAAGDCAG